MPVALLDITLIDLLSGNADGGAETSSPIAGVPYALDAAWGPGTRAAFSTALSIPGATIDTAYTGGGAHRASASPYLPVNAGWHPDNTNVFLDTFEAAVGFWKVTFPSAASYTATFLNLLAVPIVAVSAPPALTLPTIKVINAAPIGAMPARVLELSYNGTYPSGGLDLPTAQIGVFVLQWVGINDTSTLRFSWQAQKLLVYNSSGEVSGSVNFTTRGLFIGLGG